MGEIIALNSGAFRVRMPEGAGSGDTLLVRDAMRGAEGLLETAPPYLAERIEYLPPGSRA